MNEIEEKFYKTFGFEKKLLDCKKCGAADFALGKCFETECKSNSYPPITDRILLELICISGNTNYFCITNEGLPIDVEGLKKAVLHSLTMDIILAEKREDLNFCKELKHQVQSLFTEGGE